MRNIFYIFLSLSLLVTVTACGVKGKLKTPSQIEEQAAKKAKQENDKKAKEAKESEDSKEESVEQK